MNEYKRIVGNKIKTRRGDRSMRELVALGGSRFSPAALYKWENDKAQPTNDKLPYLLKALDCSLDDISETFTLAIAE